MIFLCAQGINRTVEFYKENIDIFLSFLRRISFIIKDKIQKTKRFIFFYLYFSLDTYLIRKE